MRRSILGGAIILSVLGPTRVACADTHSLLVSGPSEGEPSPSKRATIYTLYTLAGAGLLAGGYFAVQYVQKVEQRQDFLSGSPNPCADLASVSCTESTRRDDAVNEQLFLMWDSFGAAMLLSLSGIVLAQEWPNVEPEIALSKDMAYANATFRF